MKKIIASIFLFIVLMVGNLHAAPVVCTQSTADNIYGSQGRSEISTLLFTCTGDSSGAVADTVTNAANTAFIKGKYLYMVTAYGGTPAPDAADVFVLMNGEDLLGSADNLTAVKGLNLIPSGAIPNTTYPYLHYASTPAFPPIDGPLTLKNTNQTTNGAVWYIKLYFTEQRRDR